MNKFTSKIDANEELSKNDLDKLSKQLEEVEKLCNEMHRLSNRVIEISKQTSNLKNTFNKSFITKEATEAHKAIKRLSDKVNDSLEDISMAYNFLKRSK